eukprot:TRINITY_DN11992_c0_g1_i1.p1 TRINITY_DN11992_c0_g1~~TRINITY_DN11992_c0_g1_i1.p1  ORF type:complete len:165 (+),score=50.10 TRINITY_DN11992_c0_g1_i1:39-497(+)
MPSIIYDAEGNPVEVTTDEEEAQMPKKPKKKVKRSVKRKRKEDDSDEEDETGAADVDEIFKKVQESKENPVVTEAEDEKVVKPISIRHTNTGPNIKPRPGKDKSKQFWQQPGFKDKKWKAGSKIIALSNRPQTETQNEEHVQDIYSVKRGRG